MRKVDVPDNRAVVILTNLELDALYYLAGSALGEAEGRLTVFPLSRRGQAAAAAERAIVKLVQASELAFGN